MGKEHISGLGSRACSQMYTQHKEDTDNRHTKRGYSVDTPVQGSLGTSRDGVRCNCISRVTGMSVARGHSDSRGTQIAGGETMDMFKRVFGK